MGRERDVASVIDLLCRQDVALLTLIGPGGVGKTRLALEVAHRVTDVFPDGVWFIDLAPLDDAALVIPTIVQTLGLHAVGTETATETLRSWLQERRVLLLIDNVEHVVAAAPALAEVLDTSRTLAILATSRVALHIHAEREYPVAPLTVPTDRTATLAEVQDAGAIQLFLQRAQMARPDFRLTDDNAATVVEICRRLDGLPLAIGLAVARLKMLAPAALLARLSDRLRLLTGGPRDAPARQSTIRNTIVWSYDLLDTDTRRLFRQLSVFVGGWTLESAEAVCDLDLDALDGLAVLVDHSLVRQVTLPAGEPRYTMLETIREFGLERFEECDDVDDVRRRHRCYFLTLAENAYPHLRGPEQPVWVARIDGEIDNLRAALTSALDRGFGSIALRFALALDSYWSSRGYSSEGRRWLERGLASGLDAPATLRADAYQRHGALAYNFHDYADALSSLEHALSLYRSLGNQVGEALTIQSLAWTALYRGEYEQADALFEETVQRARSLNDRALLARALVSHSMIVTRTADYRLASTLCIESLELFRTLGDRSGISQSLGFLGYFAVWQGDLDRAQRLAEEALAAVRGVDVKWTYFAHELLGYVALERGDLVEAGMQFRASLGLQAPHDGMTIAECLEGLAGVAAGCCDHERGARLLGAAEIVRERFDTPVPPPRQDRYDRTLAAVRDGQNPATHDAAWAFGRQLSTEEAIQYALEEDRSPARSIQEESTALSLDVAPMGLTKREIDVLRLVSEGLMDAEVAERLFVSRRTVNTHLTSIYTKIGVTSRSAATRFAIEHGLA